MENELNPFSSSFFFLQPLSYVTFPRSHSAPYLHTFNTLLPFNTHSYFFHAARFQLVPFIY